jgi:hypothetical protein
MHRHSKLLFSGDKAPPPEDWVLIEQKSPRRTPGSWLPHRPSVSPLRKYVIRVAEGTAQLGAHDPAQPDFAPFDEDIPILGLAEA